MLRKLAIWVLLIPLPLNGLWMVCRDAPPDAQEPSESAAYSKDPAQCIKICAMKRQAESGAICLISPGDAKSSITITVFGVAVLAPAFQLQPLAESSQSIAELPDLYLSPSLTLSTPPPRV